MTMTFEKLLADTDCKSIDGATENAEMVICRELSGPKVTIRDFNSYWDDDKRPDIRPDHPKYCVHVRGYKGVSVHRYTTEKELSDYFTNRYGHHQTTTKFKPMARFRDYFCKFRLAKGGGLIQHTPSARDAEHHDIFKSDGFTIKHAKVVEIKDIESYVQGQEKRSH